MTNQEIERTKCVDLILKSNEPKKIIVAGPGTGKTYIFGKLLENKSGDTIVLTFINNLAKKLESDLQGVSQSYTFHGYCKKVFHKLNVDGITTHFVFFPYLVDIINKDGIILGLPDADYKSAFQNLEESDGKIDFYLKRANYYDAASFDDLVFRVLKYYISNSEEIPVFEQIVVDEYQDFNKLEVEFINILEKKSPILIVGDDDQAVYDFKNASPNFIREKSGLTDFRRFELPFCSRCPQVIVNAVDKIVENAQKTGALKGRVSKQFFCYLPAKHEENKTYPHIQHVQCSVFRNNAPYVSKYIDKEISKIDPAVIKDIIKTSNETGDPGILIIGPSYYLDMIYKHLDGKYKNLLYKQAGGKFNILYGYRILLKNGDSNLGWRIILEFSDLPNKEEIIKSAKDEISIIKLLPDDFKQSHLEVISLLNKIKNEETISQEEMRKIEKISGIKYDLLIEEYLSKSKTEEQEEANEDEIKIQLTTFNGAKGLSASYVFIVGFNNSDFPRNASSPTDNEICQFIVALTRTRKKCYLISNKSFGGRRRINPSIFSNWLNPDDLQSESVDKNYFK